MDMWWGRIVASLGGWGQGWLPVISLTGVFVTALVAYLSYRRALDADRRDQWWARAQWAIDAALEPGGGRRLAGLIVLTSLKTSKLATRQDAELFDEIARSVKASLGPAAARRQVAPEAAAPGEGVPEEGVPGHDSLLRQADTLLRAAAPPEVPRKPPRSPISSP
ncbi:hypothetical protein [Arthrobacter wenxiniae]|jgi:hypothetical protein|uniref:Uncharacterized protein n=1 Tax=Arthrobacter wenxiniae TaxID=2713570 RepID=A0A7Y7IDJ7_9MICC|nr:hypothetical protein [Arthrobacter wenxiniae]NVM93529.1 hypothetical protein [Arthrobacter wenxiniae]